MAITIKAAKDMLVDIMVPFQTDSVSFICRMIGIAAEEHETRR
ncbi:hypothetical protein CCACVL1_13660 [Corchorus capsularis]|uniref:Uncharacterized protein n=1 Tax=Corchorus capsularis TaxID=210143 RepID=A0A1R3IA43_COCAP|nr:hypothetical protein CCACVL1_13660 [Corchorus capsularis]